MTLRGRIAKHLASRGAYAVEYAGRWHSWAELGRIADQIDGILNAAGFGARTRVGLIVRNRASHYAALLGLVASGRCVAIINPFQSSQNIAADLHTLRIPAVVGDVEDLRDEVATAARTMGLVAIALDENDARALPGLDATALSFLPSDMAVEMLTSGTSGAPKRIPLPYGAVEFAIAERFAGLAAGMGEAPPSDLPEASLIQYAPTAQMSGLFTALQAGHDGRRLVMLEKFEVASWVAAVRAYRPRLVGLPPAMMRMVLDADVPPEDLASLVGVRSGAAPLDDQTRDRFQTRYGVPIFGIYGATEYVGPVASWTIETFNRYGQSKASSVGQVWPHIAQARILSTETGKELPAGEVGLLEVVVPSVGPDPIVTNDLAAIDSDGFLFLHGRADDAINRGGFKIVPELIADILRQHPSVADAAVVGMPDPRLGAVPVGVVEHRKGMPRPTAEDVIAFARENLLAYQVPARVLVVEALPRTPALKIDRAAIKALVGASS